MAGPSTITIITGQLRVGLSVAALQTADCQVISAALEASPNLQTVPATFCSAESQSPAATGWSLSVNVLQDWEDPNGLCWWLFNNDTATAVWQLSLSPDADAIMNGQCSIVAASFGGDAGSVLQSSVTWPVQNKPTKGALVSFANGATPGAPGAFTPLGSAAPASVAALIAGTPNVVVANPLTPFAIGQYVQTLTPGTPGQAHWSGTAWVLGAQAAATGATAGIPGAWTPTGNLPPASVAALQANAPVTVTASPATVWTTGQYVQTLTSGAGGQAYWNGTAWIAGAKP